jgi:hypothetical protein
MRRISLSVAALAFTLTPALAENWFQVVQNNGFTVSIDRDSITRSGSIVDFDGRIAWDAIQYNSGVPGGKYKLVLNREEIDCTNQTYENKGGRFFDENGSQVYSEGSEGVQPIRPNSVASYKSQAVC